MDGSKVDVTIFPPKLQDIDNLPPFPPSNTGSLRDLHNRLWQSRDSFEKKAAEDPLKDVDRIVKGLEHRVAQGTCWLAELSADRDLPSKIVHAARAVTTAKFKLATANVRLHKAKQNHPECHDHFISTESIQTLPPLYTIHISLALKFVDVLVARNYLRIKEALKQELEAKREMKVFLQCQLEMDEATLQVQRELLGAAAAISSGVVPLDVYRDLEGRFEFLQTKFDAQKLETSRLEKQVASTTALVQVGFKVRGRTFAWGRVAVEKDRSPKRDWIDEGNVAAHGGDVVADIQYFDQLDTSHGLYDTFVRKYGFSPEFVKSCQHSTKFMRILDWHGSMVVYTNWKPYRLESSIFGREFRNAIAGTALISHYMNPDCIEEVDDDTLEDFLEKDAEGVRIFEALRSAFQTARDKQKQEKEEEKKANKSRKRKHGE